MARLCALFIEASSLSRGSGGGAGGDKEINVFKVIAVVRDTVNYSLLSQPPQAKELIFVTFFPGSD
jgi:hypothetical protein